MSQRLRCVGPSFADLRTSPAADALRAAMLAVGAVHMRYRHDSTDQAGAWNVVRVAKAKVLGLVRQRIDAQEAASSALDKGDVELMIAALLSCTIASVRVIPNPPLIQLT